MTETQQEKTQVETPIDTPMKGPASRLAHSGNKLSTSRMANKLRKKRAHKRNLRRSHANG